LEPYYSQKKHSVLQKQSPFNLASYTLCFQRQNKEIEPENHNPQEISKKIIAKYLDLVNYCTRVQIISAI